MFKKVLLSLAALSLVVSVGAFAQGKNEGPVTTGNPDYPPASATKITISGGLTIDAVQRSREFSSILDLNKKQQVDFFTSGQFYLNFGAKLSENVDVNLQLKNRNFYTDTGDGSTFGTGANQGLFGSGLTHSGSTGLLNVELGDAYVKLNQFLLPQLTVNLGFQNIAYSLRGDGDYFLLDLRHSTPAFLGPLTEAFPVMASSFAGAGGSHYALTSPAAGPVPGTLGGIYRGYNQNPGGIKLTFSDEKYALDVFVVDVLETRLVTTGAFGGKNLLGKESEYVAGAVFDYNLPGDKKNLVNLTLVDFGGNQFKNGVYTFGAGADYFFGNGFEAFGQAYFQGGHYADLHVGSTGAGVFNGSGARKQVKQSSWAGELGGRYNFQTSGSVKPWVELSGWYLDGDDGNITAKNKDFVSYSNVNSMLILQNSLYGLGLKSNYYSLQGEVGTSTTLGHRPNDFKAALRYGYFRLVKAPTRWGLAPVQTSLSINKKLGNEIDARLTWDYTESVSFTLAGGFLGGADFFKNNFGTTALPAGFRAKKSAQLYLLSTDVKF